MLACWLNTIDPPPTWEALADVLESPIIGNAVLAEQLRSKYCASVSIPGMSCCTYGSSMHGNAMPYVIAALNSGLSVKIQILDISVLRGFALTGKLEVVAVTGSDAHAQEDADILSNSSQPGDCLYYIYTHVTQIYSLLQNCMFHSQ